MGKTNLFSIAAELQLEACNCEESGCFSTATKQWQDSCVPAIKNFDDQSVLKTTKGLWSLGYFLRDSYRYFSVLSFTFFIRTFLKSSIDSHFMQCYDLRQS